MASVSTSDVSALSKIIYESPKDIAKVLVRKHAALANTPSKNFATAEGMRVPAPYGTPQGLGRTAAIANTNATAALTASWLIPQVLYYATVKLDGQVVRNSANASSAEQFIDYVKYQMDMGLESLGSELNRQLFGAASGYRGVVGAVSAGTNSTITLSNVADAQYFEPGLVIVLATSATGAIRSGGTTNKATVSAVDTVNGVLTFTGQNLTTLFGTVAVSDYIFREGDAQNGNSTPYLAYGLADWNPASTPSATAFCGVDRSVFPTRLAGYRYDGTGQDITAVFINALSAASAEVGPGFTKGAFYVNPRNMAQLRNRVESSRIVSKEKMTSYQVGVETIEILGLKFIEDAFCPYGVAKMVADGAFVRGTCGGEFDWANSEPLFHDRTTDVYQALAPHQGNFIAMATNQLMHVTLPAVQ